MHEHFNTVGNYTGHTVVHRESVWDDSARARAIASVEYEESIDPATRLPAHEAYTEQKFVVSDVTNYAELSKERQRRADEAAAKEKGLPEGWNDGRRYVVCPATAEELQQAEREAERGN